MIITNYILISFIQFNGIFDELVKVYQSALLSRLLLPQDAQNTDA